MAKKKKKRINAMKNARKALSDAQQVSANLVTISERREFIDKFTLCEITCKSLIISNQKYNGTYKKDAEIRLLLKSIKAAISYAGLTIPEHILNGVFSSTGNYRKRNSKSAKLLRNGIVHALNKEDINEVHNRYIALMQVMDDFLSYF